MKVERIEISLVSLLIVVMFGVNNLLVRFLCIFPNKPYCLFYWWEYFDYSSKKPISKWLKPIREFIDAHTDKYRDTLHPGMAGSRSSNEIISSWSISISLLSFPPWWLRPWEGLSWWHGEGPAAPGLRLEDRVLFPKNSIDRPRIDSGWMDLYFYLGIRKCWFSKFTSCAHPTIKCK